MFKQWNILVVLLGLSLSTLAHAFECNLRFAKTDCWKGYKVTVEMIDADTLQPTGLSASLDKNTFATQKTFTCKPNSKFTFNAQFEPAIWANEKGKIYHARPIWPVPDKLAKGVDKWHITVCFGDNFISTPIPPASAGHCKCDFSSLPFN